MADITTDGVVGIDEHTPIYEPNARWSWWNINELYFGREGKNRYVPKVNDWVLDPHLGKTYIVEHIDPVTLIPTLREKLLSSFKDVIAIDDQLFGVSQDTYPETYRAYVNTSVFPYQVTLDKRLKVPGVATSYCKVFRGGQTNEDSTVVSKIFNNSNEFVTDRVALELVAIDSHVNYSIKRVPTFQTNLELMDGEFLTAAFYTDQGVLVYKRPLIVLNTSFSSRLNDSKKYISHISLKSPFLSDTVDNTIEFPLNVPLNAFNSIGVVHYSDGSTVEYPVDGTKFKFHGIDNYLPSIPEHKTPVVLVYTLAPDEQTYDGVTYNNTQIAKPYDLITMNPNNSYSVKLYGYPVWLNPIAGYEMRWWLFNLERNAFFEVTSLIRFDEITGPFDPLGYGRTQRKSVSLNLKDVSGIFKPFRHVQLVEIVLNGRPDETTTAWTVAQEYSQSRPAYGKSLFAKDLGGDKLNLSSDFETYEEWLAEVYEKTYPVINPSTELKAPKPTHFVLTHKGMDYNYPMSAWNQDLTLVQTIGRFDTVTIRFERHMPQGAMQLSIGAMLVR